MSNILWIDTETTGLDANIHGLREIACIVEIDGKEIERFNILLDPFSCCTREIYMSKYVKDVMLKGDCNFSDHKTYINGYIDFKDILLKYIDIADKKNSFVMAGYNVDFDSNFIKQLFKDYDGHFSSIFSYRQIDILSFARTLSYAGCFEVDNFKLETVCAKFGIYFDAHNALEDIVATRDLYEALVENYIVSE